MHRFFICALVFISCNVARTSKEEKPITKPAESINPTKHQQERRAKSENYCRAHNIPVYATPKALFVEPEEKITIRNEDDVVDRALALCYIGLKSEGLEQEHLNKFDRGYSISSKLSPLEKEYATSKQTTEQQKIDANWRYESLHVMLWALGFIDTLSYPAEICNVQ